jgi:hypothetical protein
MDRIAVIRKSLAVFALGCVSLLPLVGLIPAIVALVFGGQIRGGYKDSWNPARRYLIAGRTMACIGFCSSAILLLLIVSQWL